MHILTFIAFIVSGLFVNFCQLLLFIFVRPASLSLFRRLNKYLNYTLWTRELHNFFILFVLFRKVTFLAEFSLPSKF